MTKNNGITFYKKTIKFEEIVFEDTHKYCEKPMKSGKICPVFNNNYACPPYSPTWEQTKKILQRFKRFEILICELDLVDRISKMKEKHPEWNLKKAKQVVLNSHLYNSIIYWGLRRKLSPYLSMYPTVYILANSSCRLCGKGCAAKKSESCRHPNERVYSMESAGINVDKTLKSIDFYLEWPPITKACQVGIICFKQAKTILSYI